MSVAFARSELHRAKKEYRCDLCDEIINIGEPYLRYTGLYDDCFCDNKYHTECVAAISMYCKDTDSDEYSEDAINDWAYEKVCVNHICYDCPYTMRTRCGQVKIELGLV